MNKQLYIFVLIIVLLVYLFSINDSYHGSQVKNKNFKVTSQLSLENEVNESKKDSNFNKKVNVEGDPSNPVPPRN